MPNVLIADDNREIAMVLKGYVEKEGYTVFYAQDGEDAIRQFREKDFDMVLLDVVMPKKNGFDVCREIRKSSTVPVIMVTSKSDDYEKIMGLGIGADDYIVKPCSPGEVIARMRAVLRRIYFEHSDNKTGHTIKIHNLEIDMDSFSAFISGTKVVLTKKELENYTIQIYVYKDEKFKTLVTEIKIKCLQGKIFLTVSGVMTITEIAVQLIHI